MNFIRFVKITLMKLSLNKLKSVFGNPKAKKAAKLDDHVEAIINDIDEVPFAVSDSNVMYAGFGELGGYHFIQTIIIGSFRIKTLKGAKFKIGMDNLELNLDSDSTELESDYSEVSGRCITRIDFQIVEEDVLKIEKSRPRKLILTCGKNTLDFKIHRKEDSNSQPHS